VCAQCSDTETDRQRDVERWGERESLGVVGVPELMCVCGDV